MEILVNNSRFKLTEISYIGIHDRTNNKSILKNCSYLSKGVVLGPTNDTDSWSYENLDSILTKINVKNQELPKDYRLFVLERSKTNKVDREYTIDEVKIMSGVCRALITEGHSKLTVYRKLELIEGLVRAIGRAKPLLHLYTYGSKLPDTYQKIYKSLQTTELLKDEKVNKDLFGFPSYQGGRRYSIYELINDLVEDNSFILDTNNFKLISPIAKNEKVETERASDEWCRVLGKTGNKKRANLSIDFLANLLAEIPENNVGIEPGKLHVTAPRKICIVKDGVVINSEIAVKVNSKRLQQKLIGTGIVKERLLYKNELILDLSKLPIITRSKLKISMFDVAQTEVRYTFSSMACSYLERLIYMRDRKLTSCPEKLQEPEKSEKEKFLEKLGIYGTKLYTTRVKTESNSKYLANEVSGVIDGINTRYYSHDIYLYCNRMKCNAIIEGFLRGIDKSLITASLDDLYEEWKRRHKEQETKLRDLKFRLLLGRTFKFRCENIKKDYSVMSNKIEVPVYGEKVKVYWKFDTKNVYNYDLR